MNEKKDSKLDIIFPAAVCGTVGMIGGLGVDYITSPCPDYEQTVGLAVAHAVEKMPDAKNMSPTEVYEVHTAAKKTEKNIGQPGDKFFASIQEYNQNAAMGLGLGTAVGAGAGYATRRRKEKKEAEENGKQVS